MKSSILIVDDSQLDRCLISGLLRNNSNYSLQLAENGRQAMKLVDARNPDLVVTDLVMPEMDGLELVKTLRQRYPDIPVVLMTAHGSEQIVLEALECGAASYVPKAQQAERIVEVVERLLERVTADRCRGRLDRCVLEHQLRLALDSDPALVAPLVEDVQEMMASIGFADLGGRIRVGEALEQAVLNAMLHGNLEINAGQLAAARAELDGCRLTELICSRRDQAPYSERKVILVVKITPDEARFVIRDEGNGFNVAAINGRGAAGRFENGHNRGLTLIQSLMDGVKFNQTGNELTMWKRCQPRAANSPAGKLAPA
jgi:CheY-like chemotaxis protein